jgi:hypothetical protein
MRQILFNSLPMHAPEKLRVPAFFHCTLARVLCSQADAELRSAWTAGGGCPYTTLGRARAPVPTRGGSLQQKSAFPVMIQAVHQRNIEENAA